MHPLSQPTDTITMLQTRPQSDGFANLSSSQAFHSPQRSAHASRNSLSSSTGSSLARHSLAAPIQPYAFKATPHLRQESRTNSAPAIVTLGRPQSLSASILEQAQHSFEPSQSLSSLQTSISDRTTQPSSSRPAFNRPSSMIHLNSSVPDLSLKTFDVSSRSSPNRYRKSPQRSDSSNSLVSPQSQSAITAPSSPAVAPPSSSMPRTASGNDSSPQVEAAKRYRRRSMGYIDSPASIPDLQTTQISQSPARAGSGQIEPLVSTATIRPVSGHSHSHSHSVSSTQSAPRSVNDHGDAGSIRSQHSRTASVSSAPRRESSPVRGPTAKGNLDVGKRHITPSPLSQTSQNPISATPEPAHASSAAYQLAALSDRDLNKGMKSRLRRAFSFGSAAELRKASGGSENTNPTRPASSGAVTSMSGYDDEQAEIVRRQEAAGIGAGIYSGQGGFAGSTDNLSISSTASSASLMLRKMGTKMKKSGRSVKGLFRPKSVVGVPPADDVTYPEAQVSMVNAEAERRNVHVDANAGEQKAGATDFPQLQNNSMERENPLQSPQTRRGHTAGASPVASRKSMVGNESDRAEVLSAVKRGILKRAATSSPSDSPMVKPSVTIAEPAASPSGSPRTGRGGHGDGASSSDYFNARAKSTPTTPMGARNITFSPRIQFHDVWSSNEYDRRGDIATCNRLTPLLAQQIKEELNTLKMVSACI